MADPTLRRPVSDAGAAARSPIGPGTMDDLGQNPRQDPPLNPLERDFLNRFQGGFPLSPRPFHQVSAVLGTDEETLLATIRGMLDKGLLSRFGPLFNAERLGGCFTLAAMTVPEPRFDRTADILGAMPEVAHNYRRDHRLNMWFVLATSSPHELDASIRRIRSETGLTVFDFPKLKEYHLGFWLHLDPDGSVGVRRVEPSQPAEPLELDELDRAIVAATQTGLPLVHEPYVSIAAQTDCDAQTLIARLTRMLQAGAIRRIGAVPNHYRLGLRGNGMSVWDLDDRQVDALGARVGALDFVSHCYLRPRRPPNWRYNLFAMVHGRNRQEVRSRVSQIEAILAGDCAGHRVLFSQAILKKSGLRFTR